MHNTIILHFVFNITYRFTISTSSCAPYKANRSCCVVCCVRCRGASKHRSHNVMTFGVCMVNGLRCVVCCLSSVGTVCDSTRNYYCCCFSLFSLFSLLLCLFDSFHRAHCLMPVYSIFSLGLSMLYVFIHYCV